MKDLIIDCFAGGGGASVGIEMALGRQVDIAINHDEQAIRMIAVEEMAELTKCISKCKRYPAIDKRIEPYIESIREEVADVWIMMEQLKYLLGQNEVDRIVHEKLERQMKRIEVGD